MTGRNTTSPSRRSAGSLLDGGRRLRARSWRNFFQYGWLAGIRPFARRLFLCCSNWRRNESRCRRKGPIKENEYSHLLCEVYREPESPRTRFLCHISDSVRANSRHIVRRDFRALPQLKENQFGYLV